MIFHQSARKMILLSLMLYCTLGRYANILKKEPICVNVSLALRLFFGCTYDR